MQERLITNEAQKRIEDEYLETCFKEVYDWTISDYRAIGTILDDLTEGAFGKEHVPFANALEDLPHAVAWAIQFGELRIIPLTDTDRALLRKEIGNKVVNYCAKIGGDKPDQFRAYGATLVQTVVLAGIQVLREHSYDLLNGSGAAKTSH